MTRNYGLFPRIYAELAMPIFISGEKIKHRNRLRIGGSILLFAAIILFLFGDSHYWMLTVGLITQGLSGACIYTLGMTLISDTFPEHKLGRQVCVVIILILEFQIYADNILALCT